MPLVELETKSATSIKTSFVNGLDEFMLSVSGQRSYLLHGIILVEGKSRTAFSKLCPSFNSQVSVVSVVSVVC